MHGLVLRRGLEDRPFRDGVDQALATIADAADASRFSRYIEAQRFRVVSPATTQIRGGLTDVVNFPDAVTADAHATFRIPPSWKRGRMALRLDYSGSAASKSEIRWVLRLGPYGTGDNIETSPTAGAWNAEGPGAAGDVLTGPYRQHVDVTEHHRFGTMRIRRTGGDANDLYLGTAWLIGVEVRYFPMLI